MNNSLEVNLKAMNGNYKIPTVGSPQSAGSDLYAAEKETIIIDPGESKMIHTGIAVEIPDRYFGAIFARSGLATKQGLAPANKVGVIDSDYRGEILVMLHNHSKYPRTVNPGDRIAQLVIIPYIRAEFKLVNELDNTNRGEGGFGSTGV